MDLTDLRQQFLQAALEACRRDTDLPSASPAVERMVDAFQRLERAEEAMLNDVRSDLDDMANRLGGFLPEDLDRLAGKVEATRVRVLLTPRASLDGKARQALEGLAAAGKSLAANLAANLVTPPPPTAWFDLVRCSLATYDAEVAEVKATGRLARLG